MAYVDGFVIPVLPGRREAYRAMATEVWPIFKDYGALQMIECFEDDVPEGQVTDFRRAVGAQPGENIVFSWVIWPSKDVRDAANQKMREDPRMQPKGEVPFDMQRMIFGGFVPIVAEGAGAAELRLVAEPANV